MPHGSHGLDELLEEARAASRRAYCKYSSFPVGAAVIANGRLFTGCNIENASYGLTICAERVAIFAAVASGCLRLEMLAVTCPEATGPSASERMPCGACRQVIAEFAADDLPIIIDGVGELTLSNLLPVPFRLGGPPTA